MNQKIIDAIDKFIADKQLNRRLRGYFVGGGYRQHGYSLDRTVDSDYYEELKNVIMDAQIANRIPLSGGEFEEAIRYACERLGY